jgi:glycosyltransferase involved in cell wall biosynthesis
VLHVHSGNMLGGIETFLRLLVRLGGHAPEMTTHFAICFEGQLTSELRQAGATVHILGPVRARSPLRVIEARNTLANVVATGRYDVVVSHSAWAHAMFAPAVRRHGARLVLYIHDVPNPRAWLDRWAGLTPPDVVMCNSPFMRSSGQWWFPKTPRKMIRYPVPIDGRMSPATRATVRASVGAGEDEVVILLASRMEAWKGHGLLLDALGRLRANRRWVCWIAGGAQRPHEARHEKELRAAAQRWGIGDRVRFLGYRNDVRSLMQAADIHCQPNLEPEPFGLVFAEAMSSGLPIVTTAMGGAIDSVTPACGVLVSPDAPAVAAALARLIDDDVARAVLAKAAPARARELWDVETRMRELSREFAAIASGADRRVGS